MFRKILIATDLTAKSHNALRLAVSLARGLSADLFVLHVIPVPAELRRWSLPVIQHNKSCQLILQIQVAAAEVELKNQIRAMRWTSKEVHPLVKVGDPPNMIAATAKELGADIIVVARGTGGVLGSVAEQVVRLAGQTILVAPIKSPRRMNASLVMPVSARNAPRLKGRVSAVKSVKGGS